MVGENLQNRVTRMKQFFTSESVTEGHPDKICDQISDAVLDEILRQDPTARVACETAVTTGLVLILGEITTTASVDFQAIARETIREIGYDRAKFGFDCDTCAVITSVHHQSPDIAMGVDAEGAGDQGMMFGFACDETPEKMLLPISLAHRLAKTLAAARKSGVLPYLRPDGKTQVTVEYDDGVPTRVDTIVVSTQHGPEVEQETIRKDLIRHVIRPAIDKKWIDKNTRILVNPTGRFVIGGPQGDSGLTGRKIIVDTYGGYSRHGGGAYSGKDPTKVDRSASYAARYLAKNVVAAGLAKKCEVQISYAIGVAEPTSVLADTFGTGVIPDDKIAAALREVMDLTPKGIIRKLDLRRPIYKPFASYGHMGRVELDAPWEKEDLVPALKKYL